MHLAIINKANERILLSFKNYNEDFFYIKDKYENEKNIDINNNFLENNNERILNLNKLLQKIDISLNNKENKNEKNHEIKELKEDYKD